MGEHDKMYDFLHKYLGNYSTLQLLNDFYFVLMHQTMSDNDTFERIFNFICHYVDSSIVSLYYFERDKYEQCRTESQRQNVFGKYWNDSKEIVCMQILNKIFFYFIHSYDMGY